MIIPTLKAAYRAGKFVYKVARKTPKKVYKYGASAAGGAYIGSAIGKKKERKRVFETVKTILNSNGNGKKWMK